MPKTVWLGRNRTVALDRFIFLVFLVTYSTTYITSVNHCLWFCFGFFYCYGFLSMPNSVLGHWSFRTFECVFIFLQHSPPPPQWVCWFHLHVKCRRVFRHRYTGRCFSGWICKVWSMFLFTTLFVCLLSRTMWLIITSQTVCFILCLWRVLFQIKRAWRLPL